MPEVVDPAFARTFLQRFHGAANAHDAEAVAALCTDDVIWEDPAAPHTLHGRAEVLGFHRDIMFPALPDTRIELISGPYIAADGMGVAARVRISGTMTGPFNSTRLRPHRWLPEFRDGGVLAVRGWPAGPPHRDPEHARPSAADRRRSAAGHARRPRRCLDAARGRFLGAGTAGLSVIAAVRAQGDRCQLALHVDALAGSRCVSAGGALLSQRQALG